jgi:hypothetical protein
MERGRALSRSTSGPDVLRFTADLIPDLDVPGLADEQAADDHGDHRD